MSEHRSPHKKVDLVGPAFLIGVGIILLLNNLGYASWNIWGILWRFWPVFIIGWGLELLLGDRSWLGSVIAAVLVLAVLMGAFWYVQLFPGSRSGPGIDISEPLGDFRTARVVIEPAVGTLRIGALDDSANFVEGYAEHAAGERIESDFTPGEKATFILRTQKHNWSLMPGTSRTWNFDFHPNVDLNFAIDSGISQLNLDLSKLSIDRLDIDTGISQSVVRFPEEGEFRADIQGGIGVLTLEIPRSLAVKITSDNGIVVPAMPSSYDRHGDTYTSPNYDRADEKVDIYVELGIGTFNVREID